MKLLCRSIWRQQQDQIPPRSGRSIHNIGQDDKPQLVEQDHHDRSFDPVHIKYLYFDNVKSVIFTELESGTSKKGMHNIESRLWKSW